MQIPAHTNWACPAHAEFVADRQHALGDLIERVVPGNALPFARAARPEAAQRVHEAVGMIDQIDGHRADGTETSMIERRGRIALDLDELAVAHVQQGAAAAVATAADAFENAAMTAREFSPLARHPTHIHGRS